MALENNLVVDSDAELKAFLSSILSSEGIVVNINRTFIAYNNGTNRNRVFARCANRMAQKGTDEKFVVIALMCYPALNWILKARDIDAMIEQLHDMDTDGSVRNISEIQSLLENSTGYVKPRLHLEMRKLFFARCQQLVDAVDDAMNRAVFRSVQPCKPARISLAMAMLRGSILDSDPVSAVMIRNNFDGIIEDITKVGGEAIKELILQLAPNEGVVQGAEAAYLYHNTEVLLREYSRITHPSSVDGNSTLRLIATAGNQLDASDHKSDQEALTPVVSMTSDGNTWTLNSSTFLITDGESKVAVAVDSADSIKYDGAALQYERNGVTYLVRMVSDSSYLGNSTMTEHEDGATHMITGIEGIENGKVLVVIATYGATGDESINDAANEEVTALLSSAAPANDGASLLLDNVPVEFDGRTLSLTNERVLVKDGDSEVVLTPASYNADDIQFTDTKQTLSGFTVARSDYADSDSSKTYLVEGADQNFLVVTNNEDLLNSILQIQ